MIKFSDKKECCGCNACVQRCPKQCIKMDADNEGFYYPIIDISECIDCGLCEKVCPVINQVKPQLPIKVYAAYNKNEEVRLQSSSGGVFTLLAEETIKKGGVVFGVKFNEQWMPEFSYTETIEGIEKFRGSKYAQAIVGNSYKQAEYFLKKGREVLFSGTPCQIAGLKRFLRNDFNNLLTVDIICHGIPSPKVWNMYLKETCLNLLKGFPDIAKTFDLKKNKTIEFCIESINFRSKLTGWKTYSFQLKLNVLCCDEKKNLVLTEPYRQNKYISAFINDIILRPSCFACPSKEGKSHSDITIADFWGIDKIDASFDDDKGCGLIFTNTNKGVNIINSIDVIFKEKCFSDGIKYNSAYYRSSKPHPNRRKFFDGFYKSENISDYIDEMHKLSFKDAIIVLIHRYLEAILRRINIKRKLK